MKVGSLFSGIGGFELGFERAGMEVAFQAEYDKQARRVLARHWPDVHRYEDVHDVRDAASIDVLCGGFPCQDYSVAGQRGGLVGDRGALWWEMHRIIAQCRPAWVVGENVPGLLSSNGGRDFRTIVNSLVQIGYGVCWTVLDSQYFGVAQRRRRLFIVGHSGGIPRPEVLAISEGLFGHPAPSRETGKGTAATVAPSLNASGAGTSLAGLNGEEGCDLPIVMADNHSNAEICKDASPTLKARGYKDPPIAFHPTQDPISGHIAPAMGVTSGPMGVAIASAPRRLTPLECERLQGFPDEWTRYYADGTEVADGPRYRMLGNAVTVNVAEWIGRRIMEAG